MCSQCAELESMLATCQSTVEGTPTYLASCMAKITEEGDDDAKKVFCQCAGHLQDWTNGKMRWVMLGCCGLFLLLSIVTCAISRAEKREGVALHEPGRLLDEPPVYVMSGEQPVAQHVYA